MTKSAILAVAAAAFLATVAVADDQMPRAGSEPAVAAGNYSDLTFLRKVKLGAAYFVNPGLASNATVAYSFMPVAFKNSADRARLVELIAKGDLGLAERQGAAFKVVDLDRLREDLSVSDKEWQAAVAKAMLDSNAVIVSANRDLLGKQSDRPIVSWDAARFR